MVGWHHQLNGRGFGCRTLGVGDGQGGLACCGSWGHRESDTTELKIPHTMEHDKKGKSSMIPNEADIITKRSGKESSAKTTVIPGRLCA